MDQWPVELSGEEESLLRLCKKQPLWRFLRAHRNELFDADILTFLEGMYASGRGRPPMDVRRQALAMILQVAFDVPDHEVPTLTVADKRWQMVLGCLGANEPLLSQGTVYNFRMRAMASGFARRLLDRTVDLARETAGFSDRRLRAIIDSSPLLGAGRVEDTFNLIGRSITHVARAAAKEMGTTFDAVVEEAAVPLLSASSVKGWLDLDWGDRAQRAEGLQRLVEQFEKLCSWLSITLGPKRVEDPPISDAIEVVQKLIDQNLEPDPNDPTGKKRRLRDGNARDRQISIADPDMRHGRKTTTKLFNGYKRHVLIDADIPGLVCSAQVVPANVREFEPLSRLLADVEAQGFELKEVQVDRGYIPCEDLMARRAAGLKVLSKVPQPSNGALFSKTDFVIDLNQNTVTCPAKVTVPLAASDATFFPPESCANCTLRELHAARAPNEGARSACTRMRTSIRNSARSPAHRRGVLLSESGWPSSMRSHGLDRCRADALATGVRRRTSSTWNAWRWSPTATSSRPCLLRPGFWSGL